MEFAKKAVYLAYEEAFLKGEMSINDLLVDEHLILHWGRIHHMERFDTDTWLCHNLFELSNILLTYHFDLNDLDLSNINFPVVVDLYEKAHNLGQIIFGIKAIKHFDV